MLKKTSNSYLSSTLIKARSKVKENVHLRIRTGVDSS